MPAGGDTRRVCNLYKMRQSPAEVANLFAVSADAGANLADEVYPGYPGLVVAEGRARPMGWGFPLALTGRAGQRLKPRPVNNARADKLATAFWRDSFMRRRCLIPVTAWAEAEGKKGRMTRTWYALPDQDLFAVAGLWRRSEEWGEVYAMVMVDGCAQMAAVHDRMPVVLAPQDWQRWLAAPPDEALELCRTCTAPLLVDRTTEPWAARRGSDAGRESDSAPRLL